MLHIMLKDLKCQTFHLEIDGALTVRHLKQKLEQEKGMEYSADKQVLIYAGQVLQDESVIGALEFSPDKFIVVMKKKPMCRISDCDTNSETLVVASSGDCVKKKQQANVKPRSRSNHCMPGGVKSRGVRHSTSTSKEPHSSSANGESDSRQRRLTDDTLNAIRTNSDFLKIRAMVEKDPAKLNILVDHIARSNPELLDIITQNRDNFMELLGAKGKKTVTKTGQQSHSVRRGTVNVEIQAGSDVNSRQSGERTRSPLRGGADNNSPPRMPRAPVRQLSQSESEAIERLKSMGFEEQMVVQAYFACEKDENAAANLLIQQHED